MKKRFLQRALSAALAGVLTIPGAFAEQETDSNSFYRQLTRMVNSQDTSTYIDALEVSIGSNVIKVDGKEQIMDVSPQAQNSRTMLPIRYIAEAVGAHVDYEAETNTAIVISATGTVVRCPIGADYILVNGERVPLDSPSYAENGRTYLPVRAVSEAMDLDVKWIQSTQTVSVTAPYQTCRIVAWYEGDLNVSDLSAASVANDGTGLWVLQFETTSDARAAAATLAGWGIPVSPDRVVMAEEISSFPENGSKVVALGEHHSWGVADCGFDTFVSRYVSESSLQEVVAVVDTGVDAGHPFLQGRVLSNGLDLVDGDNNPSNDGNGHGTHVAGTVIDCCGDAPVNILPIRVFDDNGFTCTSWIAAGVKYAMDQGADVINLSLGGMHDNNEPLDPVIQKAVESGSFVSVAAGNSEGGINTETVCPAHLTCPGVAVVSAGTSLHQRATFSNYGASVDLMAPGHEINSSVPGGKYANKNGTSMATPHVSAAVALLDLAWGKRLTPAELENKLHEATTHQTWTDEYMGYGFLDLSRLEGPGSGTNPDNNPVVSYVYNVETLSLSVGESAHITVMACRKDGSTEDMTEKVRLTSSDASVAPVSNEGLVTALQPGTAYISMSNTPFADVEIPAPVPVTVTGEEKVAALPLLSYSFTNSALSFGYPENYVIPLERFYDIFGKTAEADQYYQWSGKWGGSCYGMCSTAGIFFQNNNGITPSSFEANAAVPHDLHPWSTNQDWNMTVTDFIEAMQISQLAPSIQRAISANRNKLNELCQLVEESQRTCSNLPLITIFQEINGAAFGHPLLGFAIEAVNSTESRLKVYDSNYPDKDMYITLTKDSSGTYTGWYYPLASTIDFGSDYGGTISYIPYSDYYAVWENRPG